MTHSDYANAPGPGDRPVSLTTEDHLEAVVSSLPPGRATSLLRIGIQADRARDKASVLEANKVSGKVGERITRDRLGEKVAGEQVSFKTNDGTRTRTDFVTKDRDVVETKTGNAQLSPGQTKLKADIDAGRSVTPVGKNATNAGLEVGKSTMMRSCTVDRHQC